MSDENNSNKTTFDSLIQTRQLQIIKAAIPYIQITEQKFLSIYVKYLELNQTINLVNKKEDVLKMCSVDSESDSPNEKPIRMLNDIRNYCSDSEKETIDMILNFFNAFEIYNCYVRKQGEGNGKRESPLSFFKNFMTPEQKEVFEAYKTQFT